MRFHLYLTLYYNLIYYLLFNYYYYCYCKLKVFFLKLIYLSSLNLINASLINDLNAFNFIIISFKRVFKLYPFLLEQYVYFKILTQDFKINYQYLVKETSKINLLIMIIITIINAIRVSFKYFNYFRVIVIIKLYFYRTFSF